MYLNFKAYYDKNNSLVKKQYLKLCALACIVIISATLLSACHRKNIVPQLQNIAIHKVEMVGELLHVEFMLKIQNPSSVAIAIILDELEIYKNYEKRITHLEAKQSYTLAPGENYVMLPLQFHKDLIIENALSLFFHSEVAISLRGSFSYSYRIAKGKFRFNQNITLNLNNILNSLLKNKH